MGSFQFVQFFKIFLVFYRFILENDSILGTFLVFSCTLDKSVSQLKEKKFSRTCLFVRYISNLQKLSYVSYKYHYIMAGDLSKLN